MAFVYTPRRPGQPMSHTGLDTDEATKTVISPVEEWEKTLSTLVEAGEIPEATELQIHRHAWKIAAYEAEVARFRALASQYSEKQARAGEPLKSGASYAWRAPGDYCAACAARYCECPDRQR